jgi:uncharacterized heparinase superfamily protein
MQTLSWYVRRARSMSGAELTWRLQSMARDAADRCRLALDLEPKPAITTGGAPLAFTPAAVGCWNGDALPPAYDAWRRQLVRDAEAAAAHRLSFFNLVDRHLGDPIQWNVDHETGKSAPVRFAPSIDYRDIRVAGDAKVVWEPARHHQLVVLGRAYRATGRMEFADAVAEQISSWIDQCPYGRGMHWRSPLELAIRIINWSWAIELIHPSGVVSGAFEERLLRSLHQHLWDLTRKYSRGSSANNHRLGEAAGVFIATACVPAAGDPAWHEESRAILSEEVIRQSHADGGTREQALSYQMFVLQFVLAAAHVGRARGSELSAPALDRAGRMLEFIARLSDAGAPPMFGDSDDGYVLDLGGRGSPQSVLALGAAILNRPDLCPAAAFCEPAFWVLGDQWSALHARADAAPRPLQPHAFHDTGIYLLQSGRAGEPDAVSVTMDAAELGYGPLAAHGHADALAITLRLGGTDILVDTGTCDYFTDHTWRTYFRTTAAHNTIGIDGLDQSVITGPFMWGDRATATLIAWEPSEHGGRVAAEHDGYRRLADPVTHRREVRLDAARHEIDIEDTLDMQEEHDVRLALHLSEICSLVRAEGAELLVEADGRRLTFSFDPRLRVEALHGSMCPRAGWISRGYHHRAPVLTLIGSARLRGPQRLRTRISFGD